MGQSKRHATYIGSNSGSSKQLVQLIAQTKPQVVDNATIVKSKVYQ